MSDEFWKRLRIPTYIVAVLAAVFGIGYFAEYPQLRDALRAAGLPMPDQLPLGWSLAAVLFVFSVGMVWQFAKVWSVRPRLCFGEPVVHRARLNDRDAKDTLVPHFCLASIPITNTPRSHDDGRPVRDAFCIAEFIDANDSLLFSVEYARWDENPKPREDETPNYLVPRFLDVMNYRELKPNGAKNNITFAVKDRDQENCFGFAGACQDDYKNAWQAPKYGIPPGEYFVRLWVRGAGTKPLSQMLRLRNRGAGHYLECTRLDFPSL